MQAVGKEFTQMTVSRGLEKCLDCPCEEGVC